MGKAAAAYAERIGYSIEYADLRKYGREAMCHFPSKTIFVQPGMLHRKERSLTWHEIAHAVFGDEPSMLYTFTEKQERRADEWAAHMLIDHAEYTLAEERFGSATKWISQELGVLEKLVDAYGRTLHRIGDKIYVNPRMGSGQWDRRFEVA